MISVAPRTGFHLRSAETRDAHRIVTIIREGFRPEFLSMTPYGCEGIASYCALQIQNQRYNNDTLFYVGELNGEVNAVIELKLTTDSMFVNYVSVAKKARSLGVASSLLHFSIESCRTPEHRFLRLDVLDGNAPARAWYDRLGFKLEFITEWWHVNVRNLDARIAYTTGLPQADVTHKQFGFSQFTIVTRAKSYTIGRLGTGWLRVTDPDLLEDAAAMSLLSKHLAVAKVLVIAREGEVDSAHRAQKHALARTFRMRLELASFLENRHPSGSDYRQ